MLFYKMITSIQGVDFVVLRTVKHPKDVATLRGEGYIPLGVSPAIAAYVLPKDLYGGSTGKIDFISTGKRNKNGS